MKRILMIGAVLASLVFGATASSQAYPYVRPVPRIGPRFVVPPYGPRAFVGPRYYGPGYRYGYYRPGYSGYRGWGPGFYGPGFYGPRIGFGIY
jgi:hypothetical protein